MNILGIGGYSHDSAACLVIDGKLVAAAMEERFTRRKHEGGIPIKAIQYCLKEGGIRLEDLDYIGTYMNPWLRLRKRVPYRIKKFFRSPLYSASYLLYEIYHNATFIFETRSLKKSPKTKVLFLPHHPMHAASAFFVSPFEKAALFSIDYIGEMCTTFLGIGEGKTIRKIKEIEYPHSLGVVYSALTDYLGFQRANDEYKVMGLAAYGEPTYYEEFSKIVKVTDEGDYKIDLSYFIYHYKPGSRLGYVSDKFIKIFGPPRRKGEEIQKRHMDIASSLQKVLEDSVLKLLEYLYKKTKCKNLCIAGGVGLNSVMNGRIERESPFQNLYIQPAASDDGISIGAAFYIYHSILGKERSFVMEHAFWGPSYSNREIEEELKLCKLPYRKMKNVERETAQLLREGKIVGWFQGRMEFGPRALGARSILADPTRKDMKDIINKFVKHREEFRPFAPTVLEEEAPKYFEGCKKSPFMLLVYPVVKEKQEIIPAVTHVDGSARVQTIDSKTAPRYYRMIKEFEKLKGVPVVLNTSFNVKGEPIVCSPQDALRCFYSTGMDALVIGDFLVEKR